MTALFKLLVGDGRNLAVVAAALALAATLVASGYAATAAVLLPLALLVGIGWLAAG
ncbi:MAG TPA: hypothetical protein VL244_00945 [Alphaproteobacteria bacterium]|nr:hypothetical protein [Alphaproteobacteria bacterium]